MSLRRETQHNDYKKETFKHISNQLLITAIKERKWRDAESIVYNDEAYSRIKDPNNFLPLHLAIDNGCSTRLITLLLGAYPESILMKDPNGRYI